MEPKQSYKENNYPYYHQVIGNDISNTWHDAAQKELGSDWRMPTKEEWHELLFPPSMNGYLYMTVKGICLQQKRFSPFLSSKRLCIRPKCWHTWRGILLDINIFQYRQCLCNLSSFKLLGYKQLRSIYWNRHKSCKNELTSWTATNTWTRKQSG